MAEFESRRIPQRPTNYVEGPDGIFTRHYRIGETTVIHRKTNHTEATTYQNPGTHGGVYIDLFVGPGPTLISSITPASNN